jgi:ATP phosphoribosyltransferase regulatory subunit
MRQWQFHTPDGVMDYLPEDCNAKRRLENQLRSLFQGSGYEEIETPGIEFYDVYASGSGLVPQEGLFKFFDQQGRILCLRYDGTVPTARVAATLYRDSQLPLRFCYINTMYRYNESGGGRQREFTQAGVELMGSQAPEADAEVIATAIAAARAAGIEDLQVSIGQVNFFKGLLAEWGLAAEEAQLLPRLIDAKDMVALEDRLGLNEKARAVLLMMPSQYGTYDVIDQLASLVSHPLCLAALANLREVLDILADYGLLSYVSLDLGMLQSLNYYTGVIFKGFTYGLGFPLFSGGRYDQVSAAFGREMPATGFSIGLNFVLTALRRQGRQPAPLPGITLLAYAPGQRALALQRAGELRSSGLRVTCDCENLSFEQLAAVQAGQAYTSVLYLSTDGEMTEI